MAYKKISESSDGWREIDASQSAGGEMGYKAKSSSSDEWREILPSQSSGGEIKFAPANSKKPLVKRLTQERMQVPKQAPAAPAQRKQKLTKKSTSWSDI